MDTTLTKRTLSGAFIKASSIFQNNKNAYKIKIQVEKANHNLLIGGYVNLNITGVNTYSFDFINDNNVSQPINDFFNQQRQFYVVDANTLICEVDVNSSFSDALITLGGTPVIKVNNDRITIPEGNYNFELLNKAQYQSFRIWDLNYKFKIQENGISDSKLYKGASDYYSDGTITSLPDLNEQDLFFRFCESVEIAIVDADNNYIATDDYTKTTNIGLIINKL